MSKRTKYIIAIAVLLVANLVLLYTSGISSSSSFDDGQFAIQDTTGIETVLIRNAGGEVQLRRTPTNWKLNEDLTVDPNFLDIFFSILSKVSVKRELGEMETEGAGEVTITFDDGTNQSFAFKSDGLGTKSFFIKEGVGYQVEVPGYRDNVVNIFELNEDQWRNRMVFDGSWRTIQKLSLDHQGQSLQIQFDKQFFTVAGIFEMDSSAVVEYLNQFQYFQANEMISEGRFPDLDELKSSDPIAVLRIEDIKSEGETTFEIYPNLPGQTYHLVTKNKEQMMVFDRLRIQSLLRSGSDFRVQ